MGALLAIIPDVLYVACWGLVIGTGIVLIDSRNKR